MTILWAQVESNERGMCRCGQQATSELSYAKEMDQRQDASSPSPPLSPPTDRSYRTPPVEEEGRLIPVPEDVQLPSPTSSEEVTIPILPPRATTLGREVSGKRCWTCHKVDQPLGAGASGRLFWRSSGLRGKDCTRPYPAGCGVVSECAGSWGVRASQQPGSSKPGPSSPWLLHAPFHNLSLRGLPYGWKSISPSRSPRD